MNNLKLKLILVTTIIFLGIIAMQTSVLGTNENIELLKKQSGDYLIYIKDNLNTDFEFAFSNNKNENKVDLVFTESETDSSETNANKIAFVNSSNMAKFNTTTYMWAKEGDNYILEGLEVDLNQAINEKTLEELANVTKNVKTEVKQETTEQEAEGKKITTTVGKVVLPEEAKDYSYALLKVEESEKAKELFDIANKISKFNDETDMYTKLKTYKAFSKAIEEVVSNVNSEKWTEIKNNEIEQPEDSKDGDQYVLLLGRKSRSKIELEDVQFLTSTRKESEEKIIEKITTKLPVTYDNNTLLIVLAILIVSIIIVSIRIKALSKKQEK